MLSVVTAIRAMYESAVSYTVDPELCAETSPELAEGPNPPSACC